MSVLRRRGMLEAEEASPYPYESNYPEFNEYGAYILTPVAGTASSSTNAFLKSGTTNYTYMGSFARNIKLRLEINSETQKITIKLRRGDDTGWGTTYTKNFAGFPVKFKRCAGAEANNPNVTFIVTEE